MKLLLAVLFIATVCAPATALTLKDITRSNFSWNYYLEIENEGARYGYFELRSSPEYYVSSVDSVTLLLNPEILLHGVGVSTKDAKTSIIQAGIAQNFGPVLQEMKKENIEYAVRPTCEGPELEFILNTYLLAIPDSLSIENIKVVVLMAERNKADRYYVTPRDADALVLNGKQYISICEPNPRSYHLKLNIHETSTTLYEFEDTDEMRGPFVALPIPIEHL